MAFHEELLSLAKPVWEAMLAHPFLAATATGQVTESSFKTWLAQDYLYVRETVPFLGVLLAKAPPALRDPLSEAIGTLNRELELFRQQAEELGVVLEGLELAPTCHAYTQFMLATAYARPFAAGFTVLYGLEKAYLDSWMQVKTNQQGPSPYQAFIDNWTSQAFQDYVAWLGRTLDELVHQQDRLELERLFLLTARYEYLFWQMAWNQEGWPV
jgi:thiaminase/transcriptional activator TenA